MEREELKGKQTKGIAIADGCMNGSWTIEVEGGGVSGGTLVTASRAPHELIAQQMQANALLYAEAHNVANETGMWPLDMAQRIKELEEVLREVDEDAFTVQELEHMAYTKGCELSPQRAKKALLVRTTLLNKK